VNEDTKSLPALPHGWAWTTTENLSSFENNAICAGPFGTIFKAKDFRDSGIPIIFLRHVAPGQYLTHKPGFMDADKWEEMFKEYSVFGGELLVTKLGEPPGVCAIYPEGIGSAMVTPDVIKMTVNKDVTEAKYLMHYFNSERARKFAFGIAYGATRLRMNLPIFRQLSIPLAPLNEQRRIVAKIEALKARSQRVKEELEAIAPLLDQFRQSVLAAAFRGDLTADWREKNPDVEPASVLLERIRAERRRRWEEAELEKMKAQGKTPKDDKWKEKYKEPSAPDTTDLPQLPKAWVWVGLADICSLIADIDHKMPEAVTDGVKFLSAKDLLDEGTLNLTDNIKLISHADYERLSRKVKPQRNDIIYSRIGARLGKARLVETDEKFLVSYSCCTIRPLIVNPKFLAKFLNSEFVLKRAMGETQSIGVPDLGLARINEFAVPLCSLAEQAEIIRRLDLMFDFHNVIQKRLIESTNQVEQLNQSILVKAFRGELVPQDPNDEPASVLLERIRAEREKLDTKKKAKGKTEKKSRKAKPEPAEPKQLSLPGFE
jgi:type I restriction enzyme S subunit